MALTAEERAKLKPSDFVFPERRAYPIHDPAHAVNALVRIKTYGTKTEGKKVYNAVCKRYGDRIPACKVGFETWWYGKDKYKPARRK